MTLKRKLYLTSVISLTIAILSQIYIESPMFENYDDGAAGWDKLGTAVWTTVIVTLPAAAIAVGAFLAAVIMSVRQRKKNISEAQSFSQAVFRLAQDGKLRLRGSLTPVRYLIARFGRFSGISNL
ncbi:hypothetical protein IPL85_05785 [Candidatus Saccharibacteria bacterium]|nr:MAG: hypothetical protein IPL85_05785 [Candidatus Saccharibacteria bacterium]